VWLICSDACFVVCLYQDKNTVKGVGNNFIPSIFPTITCLRRQVLRKILPIHLSFLCFIVSWMSLLSLIYVTLLNFSCDPSKWSFSSFFSTTFRNFQGIRL
jgi:hypothetical protein